MVDYDRVQRNKAKLFGEIGGIDTALGDAASEAEVLIKEDDATNGPHAIPGMFGESTHIPYELMDAVIAKESEWVPDAYNNDPCGPGNSHATGLGQFCLNYDDRNNPGKSSLELSDYQRLTGKRVSVNDVLDPKKDMVYVGFGLADRYSRLKDQGESKPDWYQSAVGYSPNPKDTAGSKAYTDELYDYVLNTYGKEKADALRKGEGGSGGSTLKKCGIFEISCYLSNAATLGSTLAGGTGAIGEDIGHAAWKYAQKFIIIGAAAVAVILGLVLIVKPKPPALAAAKAIL